MTLKELFNSPDKWCKRQLAEDKNGNWCSPNDERAVRWCLLGGCMKCLGFETLRDVIRERTGQPITIFNDAPDTTFDDILEVLQEWEQRNDKSA